MQPPGGAGAPGEGGALKSVRVGASEGPGPPQKSGRGDPGATLVQKFPRPPHLCVGPGEERDPRAKAVPPPVVWGGCEDEEGGDGGWGVLNKSIQSSKC